MNIFGSPTSAVTARRQPERPSRWDEHLVVDVDRPVAYPPEDQRTDTAAVNIPVEGIGPAKPHGVPNRFASCHPRATCVWGCFRGPLGLLQAHVIRCNNMHRRAKRKVSQ